MADVNVTQLIINKLTKAQYDALQDKSETELYLVPDEIDDTPTSGRKNPVTSDGLKKALDTKEESANKVTSISQASTDTQYPTAKAVYDFVQGQIGNINSILETI